MNFSVAKKTLTLFLAVILSCACVQSMALGTADGMNTTGIEETTTPAALTLVRGNFAGYDLGFNASNAGDLICVRFEKPDGTDWNTTAITSGSMTIRAGDEVIWSGEISGTIGSAGTGNAYYQIGRTPTSAIYTADYMRENPVTDASVELTIVDGETTYSGSASGLSVYTEGPAAVIPQDPWAADPAKTEYEIYHHQVYTGAAGANEALLKPNSTRSWLQTATLNGGSENLSLMAVYNNTSTTGGLPEGETMELDVVRVPDIDTDVFGAANLSFRYFYYQDESDLHIRNVDMLQVQVSTDHGVTWSEQSAGLRSHELLGAMVTTDGKHGVYFEVTTEDILSLVPAGSVITDVRLRPYGDYPQHWGAFRIGEIVVTGYKTELPAQTENPVDTIAISEETLRQIVVAEAYRTAESEWIHDSDIVTYNWNGSYNTGTALPMRYYGGYLHKGPVYTRAPAMISSREMWQGSFLNGLHTGGTVDGEAVGMDCSTFVFNATSRISDAYDWQGRILALETTKRPLVGALDNDTLLTDTKDIRDKYTQQEVFEHYALAQPGDIADTVPNAAHERLVTGMPVVVRNADGTINPAQSTIAMSEAGGSVYYYWRQPDGSVVRSKTAPATYQTSHPESVFLYGRSALKDEVYTFQQLYNGEYLIFTLKEYADEEINGLVLNMVTEATAANLVEKGLLVGLESNYRMISITAKLWKDNEIVFEDMDYLQQRRTTLAYSNDALNAKLQTLFAGSYTLTLDVTAGPVTTADGAVPVTRVLEMDFTVTGEAASALTIVQDSFAGYDLGFNSNNTGGLLCVRFEKPEGTDWGNTAPASVAMTIRAGEEVLWSGTHTGTIGSGGTGNAYYQIGRTPIHEILNADCMRANPVTNANVEITIVDGETTYHAAAYGLTIYTEAEGASAPLTIVRSSFDGYDLGFNSNNTGNLLCVRLEKPDGTNWGTDGITSGSMVIRVGDEVLWRGNLSGTIGSGGTDNAYYQIGRTSLSSIYTAEHLRAYPVTDASVEITVQDGGVTYTGTASGLTIYSEAQPLTIVKDSFAGYDLGFNSNNTGNLICVRLEKPDGSDWGTTAITSGSMTVRIGDEVIWTGALSGTIGSGGTGNVYYQIGKTPASATYTADYMRTHPVTDASIEISVTAGDVTYGAYAAGLTVYNEVVPLNIVQDSFGGYDLGFNAGGNMLCMRFDKPDGTDWGTEGSYPQRHTVTVKDSQGNIIYDVTNPNDVDASVSIGSGGTGNAYYQIGKSAAWMQNGYTIDGVKGLTGVSVLVRVETADTVYQGTAAGLTIAE